MRLAVAGLAAALALVLLAGAYSIGVHDARRASYARQVDTLRIRVAELDTVYHRDTVVFWRLKRAVDTLIVPESIPVIARDSSRADSALRTATTTLAVCSAVVVTCELRVAAERRLREAAEAALGAPPAPTPRLPVRAFSVGVLTGVAGTAAAVLFLRR